MWKSLSLLVVSLFVLPGCFLVENLTGSSAPVDDDEPVLVPEYNGVIFPASQNAPAWTDTGEINGFWTPTLDDVRTMETDLPGYLESLGEEPFWGERVWEDLDTYYRQYGGILIDGQPVLYTFFSCTELENWQEDWVLVSDGGACFFNISYDTETGEFFDLAVNGFA